MEELVKKIENLFGQKLEVVYEDQIIVRSSSNNPPDSRNFELKYDNHDDAVKGLTFLINVSNGTQEKTTKR